MTLLKMKQEVSAISVFQYTTLLLAIFKIYICSDFHSLSKMLHRVYDTVQSTCILDMVYGFLMY